MSYNEERFCLTEEDLTLLQSGKCIKCYGDKSAMILVPPTGIKGLFE